MIDKPYVLDRESVKTYLQISDTTYDDLIDIYLPIVSEDIEGICNQCFVKEYEGTITSGSLIITDIVLGTVSKNWLVSSNDYDNAKITDADLDEYTLTVDAEATTSEEDTAIYINQFPIAKRVVASQMVAFQITKNSGINTVKNGAVTSKSLPPLSITYDTNDVSLKSGFGYPSYIVSSLEQIRKPRFI